MEDTHAQLLVVNMSTEMRGVDWFIRIGGDIIEDYLKEHESGGEIIEIEDSDEEVV